MHARPWIRIALLVALPGAAFAADGDLDPTFSSDGKADFYYAPQGRHSEAVLVVALPDGSLLVGGRATHNLPVLLRLSANGTRDVSYGASGWIFDPFSGASTMSAVLPLPGGKILLTGSAFSGISMLARFDASGNADLTFGPFGRKELAAPPFAAGEIRIRAAALDHQGRIVVVASCTECAGKSDARLLLTRLDSDGDVDTSFGAQGWSLLDFTSGTSASCDGPCRSRPLALDASGRILVAVHRGPDPFAVVRFLPTGAVDSSFGNGDGIEIPGISLDVPVGLAVHPDSGAILLSVSDGDGASGVLQLQDDGDIDTTFGLLGLVNLSLEEGVFLGPLAIQSDGKILTAGSIDHTGTQERGFFLARLLPSGELDDSFDGNGVVRHEFDLVPDAEDTGVALALSGGRAVVVGSAEPEQGTGEFEFAILRTQSTLIFADGFGSGTTLQWAD